MLLSSFPGTVVKEMSVALSCVHEIEDMSLSSKQWDLSLHGMFITFTLVSPLQYKDTGGYAPVFWKLQKRDRVYFYGLQMFLCLEKRGIIRGI